MPEQLLGDRGGVRGVLPHPHRQRLDPPGQEERLHRRQHRACGELEEGDLLRDRVVGGDDARRRSRRSGRRGTSSRSARPRRRRASAAAAGRATRRCCRPPRPRRPRAPRAASASMSTIFMSGLVGVSSHSSFTGDANAAAMLASSVRSTVSSTTPERHVQPRDQPVRAAVGVVAEHHAVARLHERAQQRVLGGEPRGERGGVGAELERGDLDLERGPRGVAAAAVLVPVPEVRRPRPG